LIFVIDPYVGAGPLRLGATVDEVRSRISEAPKTFMKSPLSQHPTDAFLGVGVHAYYRQSGTCEAFEFHKPAVVLFTTQLLGRPFGQLLSWFTSIDPDVQAKPSGLTSLKYGVGLFAPSAQKAPAEPTQGVIVFAKGYYEAAKASLGRK